MYRNRFFNRARGALIDVLDGLRDKLAEKITREDLEHYITVASLYGIKHYMSKNPKFKQVLYEVFPESTEWDLEEEPVQHKKTKKHRK